MPVSDIELRNACLNDKEAKTDDEMLLRECDRMIAAVFHKEIEYRRSVELLKKKLLGFHNVVVDKAFSLLSDEVTGYLSFKR